MRSHRWDYETQRKLFDREAGADAMEEGIALVSEKYEGGLIFARNVALRLGMRQSTVNADDVQRWLLEHEYPMLGPEAGSLFRSTEWEWTGNWIPSERVSNHTRMLREWRLKRRPS